MPVAPAQHGEVETAVLEGTRTTRVYQIPVPGLLEELVAQLRAQLADAGYVIVLDCVTRGCGGYDFLQAVSTVPPPEMVVDLGRFGFLSTRMEATGEVVTLTVSVAGDTGYVQVTTLVPAEISELARTPFAEQTVSEQADEPRGAFFDGRGAVVLEGLKFETGGVTLSQSEYPGLVQLAAFLLETPDARVTLVGHTDAEGALAPNIALSRARAEAVRVRLVEGFGVNPGQLQADGVGFLAPRASNITAAGRLMNRRVEAVLTTPE
jgi:OOP family OmpA-OmpF porin